MRQVPISANNRSSKLLNELVMTQPIIKVRVGITNLLSLGSHEHVIMGATPFMGP